MQEGKLASFKEPGNKTAPKHGPQKNTQKPLINNNISYRNFLTVCKNFINHETLVPVTRHFSKE